MLQILITTRGGGKALCKTAHWAKLLAPDLASQVRCSARSSPMMLCFTKIKPKMQLHEAENEKDGFHEVSKVIVRIGFVINGYTHPTCSC